MRAFDIDFPVEVHLGQGTFGQVGQRAAKFGKTALVVMDPFYEGSTIAAALLQTLTDSGVRTLEWYDVVPNPRFQTCDKAAAIARTEGCDLIVGLGGGSALDTAKAVSLVAVHGGSSWEYTSRKDAEVRHPTEPGLPMILIPTTAGTGSEVTPFAVLSDRERGLKATIVNKDAAWPKVAIVDPVLHLTKPESLTASTGVDTFLHAFEGYIGRHATPWTDHLGEAGMRLFFENIEKACKNGSDIEARSNMALSCCYSGMSLSSIGISIPHSLGQALGAMKDTPHGESCAACSIPVIEWSLPFCEDRFARVAEIMDPALKGTKSEKAAKFPEMLRSLYDRVGLTQTFGSLGLTDTEVETLADIAYRNYGSELTCSVKEPSRDEVVQLIRASL